LIYYEDHHPIDDSQMRKKNRYLEEKANKKITINKKQ
jgi:hypothetical protein